MQSIHISFLISGWFQKKKLQKEKQKKKRIYPYKIVEMTGDLLLKFPKALGQSQCNALLSVTAFISLVNFNRYTVALPGNYKLNKIKSKLMASFCRDSFLCFFLYSGCVFLSLPCIHQFSQSIGTKLWVVNLWLLFRFIIVVINVVVIIFLIFYLCFFFVLLSLRNHFWNTLKTLFTLCNISLHFFSCCVSLLGAIFFSLMCGC